MDKLQPMKPRTMAELLPELSCLISKEDMHALTLTTLKKPRPTIGITRTNEKVLKPMTLAEMRKCLQINSPKSKAQMPAPAKRKWNSSAKLENKKVSHTANGQLKHNSVRKLLTFQPPKPVAPKSLVSSRIKMLSSETPQFPKPEIKAMKSVHFQDRISGICNIPETPVMTKSRIVANKENIPSAKEAIVKKSFATHNTSLHKKVLARRIPETPISNDSRTSGEDSDASFLQNEVAVEHIESKPATLNEQPPYNIPETTPTTSSPFTKYRSATDFFNNLSDFEDITDNTIMCFDNTVSKDDIKHEESIESLCDMLKKTKMPTQNSDDIYDLLEMQKNTEICIQTLDHLKEQLQYQNNQIQKLIHNRQLTSQSIKDETNTLNVKFPLYKIPKKPFCKKKISHKTLSDISAPVTPLKNMGDKALCAYMKLKQQNKYLVTPISKPTLSRVPDTHTKVSHNLQKQLDKLYEGN